MFYRLKLSCNVFDPVHIEVLKAALRLLFNQSVTINPGQPNREQSYIDLQVCYHDETPTKPCELLEHVETPP